MTINEAIIYAEEMAATDGNRKRQDNYNQIAEWLKDYMRMLQQDTCEDCISRQAAIDLANELKDDLPDDDHLSDMVMSHNEGVLEYQTKLSLLPPVNPQPKIGHWLAVEDEEGNIAGHYCSECDLPLETEDKTMYCPHCGCRMTEVWR